MQGKTEFSRECTYNRDRKMSASRLFALVKSTGREEYGFETSVELEGGIRQMCNLSDLVEARGIERGKSAIQIADEMEESLEDILLVYNALKEEQEG